MTGSIGDKLDIGSVVVAQHEARAVPCQQFGDRVHLEMTFSQVFGVKAENAARFGALATPRLQLIELRGCCVEDFGDHRRTACVVSGRAGARSVHGQVDVDIAVARQVVADEDKLPLIGAERGILRVGQRRNLNVVRFPQSRHLGDFRACIGDACGCAGNLWRQQGARKRPDQAYRDRTFLFQSLV